MEVDHKSTYFQRVVFLGTSSACPVPNVRNCSATAIVLSDSSVILCDCGEGTQHQIFQSKSIKFAKISTILITHLHGDHSFGLFGMLCTMGMQDRTESVTIVGPVGVKEMVETVLRLQGGWHCFELNFQEIEPETSCDFAVGAISINARPLTHRVPAFGYILTASDKPGSLDAKKAIAAGAKGQQLGQLKSGADVTLDDGTVLHAADFIGQGIPGKKIAFIQDTSDSTQAVEACQNVDILIHEATYDDSLREKCIEWGHSTAAMAAEFALQVKARMLVLTHFSTRYGSSCCSTSSSSPSSTTPSDVHAQEGSSTNAATIEDLLKEARSTICEHKDASDTHNDDDNKKHNNSNEIVQIQAVAAVDFMAIRSDKKMGFVVESELDLKPVVARPQVLL